MALSHDSIFRLPHFKVTNSNPFIGPSKYDIQNAGQEDFAK